MATNFTLSIPASAAGSTPVTPSTPSVRPSDAECRLNEAERLITDAMSNAAGVVQELAKEKAVLRNVEQHVGEFAGNVTKAEQALLEQIAYLQHFQGGHAFESSAYGAIKDAEIAEERLQLIAELVRRLPVKPDESATVTKGNTTDKPAAATTPVESSTTPMTVQMQ